MGVGVTTDFIDLFKNDWFLLSDFTDLFVGNFIANGTSRSVYEFRLNHKHVIKIDRSSHFNNVAEWDIWHNLKDKPEIAKFLAPCIYLSSCGRVMIQEKTKPVTIADLPDEIPAFFEDSKLQNWGKLGSRIVCHDYANHRFYSGKLEMTKAKWWSDRYQIPDEKSQG